MTHIEISNEDITALLKKSMKNDCPPEVLEVLCIHMHDNLPAMSQLVKAFMGVSPKSKFKIGDRVKVSIEDLPRWRMNVTKMIEKELIHNNYMSCVVNKIDLKAVSPIHVEYTYIDNNDVEKVDSYPVREMQAYPLDTFIEKIDSNVLPF